MYFTWLQRLAHELNSSTLTALTSKDSPGMEAAAATIAAFRGHAGKVGLDLAQRGFMRLRSQGY